MRFLIAALILALPAALVSAKKKAPDWTTETIIPEDEFIYAVGRSEPRKTRREAKADAVADATEQFVKYCGVSVEAFSRSVETYSMRDAESHEASDIMAQSRQRSKAFVSRAIPDEWHVIKKRRKYTAWVLLRVPREEFDRIVAEKNIKLSMDVQFYHEDQEGHMRVMTEGTVLKSGDGYSIYVRSSDEAHLYIYQVDALGKSYRLFPNEDFLTAKNPVPPATDLWIPNDKDLFTLDETTGREKVYIFAAFGGIAEFDGEGGVSLTQKEFDNVIALKKMGVAGLKRKRDSARIDPRANKRDVAAVKRKLQAEGAFVYETWFWHK